jgi:serine/threonine protein kinase
VSGAAEKVHHTSPSAVSGTRKRVGAKHDGDGSSKPASLRVGRYVVEDRIAAGGMATVHIGRLRGAAGFSRTVAIKRLLPQFACNPEFEALFVHEARLVARIQHPNVVATLDVVADAGELILVMDYVPGETLSRLMQAVATRSERVPERVALAIVRDALSGLHAAHEARDRRSEPLDIVHRDISPQNLIVGSDGVTRVLDFGIAKAATSVEVTREGLVRGKAAYMAPEQLTGAPVTRRADIFAIGVVLWEILVGERLFPGGTRPELASGGDGRVASPRARGAPIEPALDAIVMRALAPRAEERFDTAQQMLEQLSPSFDVASREEVAHWVADSAGEDLKKRAALVARIESLDLSLPPPPLALGEPPAPAEPSPLAVDVASSPALIEAAGAQASSRFRRAAWAAAALSALVGIASAFWGNSRESPKSEQDIAISNPPAAPGSPLSKLDKNAGRPLITAGDSPASENRARSDAPALAAQPTASSALPPAPSAVSKAPSRPGKSRKASKPASKPGCNPPYTVDAAGRRHYKLHCF